MTRRLTCLVWFMAILLLFSLSAYGVEGHKENTNLIVCQLFNTIDRVLEEGANTQEVMKEIKDHYHQHLSVKERDSHVYLLFTEKLGIEVERAEIASCSMVFFDRTGTMIYSVPIDIRYTTKHILRAWREKDTLFSLLPPYQTDPVTSLNQIDYSPFTDQHSKLPKQSLIAAKNKMSPDEYALLQAMWFASQVDYLMPYEQVGWLIENNQEIIAEKELRTVESYGSMKALFLHTESTKTNLQYGIFILLDHEDRVVSAEVAPAKLGEKIAPVDGMAFGVIRLGLRQEKGAENSLRQLNDSMIDLFQVISDKQNNSLNPAEIAQDYIRRKNEVIWSRNRERISVNMFGSTWLEMDYPNGENACLVVTNSEYSLSLYLKDADEHIKPEHILQITPSKTIRSSRTEAAFAILLQMLDQAEPDMTLNQLVSFITDHDSLYGNRYRDSVMIAGKDTDTVVYESPDYGEGIKFALLFCLNKEKKVETMYLAPILYEGSSEILRTDLLLEFQ